MGTPPKTPKREGSATVKKKKKLATESGHPASLAGLVDQADGRQVIRPIRKTLRHRHRRPLVAIHRIRPVAAGSRGEWASSLGASSVSTFADGREGRNRPGVRRGVRRPNSGYWCRTRETPRLSLPAEAGCAAVRTGGLGHFTGRTGRPATRTTLVMRSRGMAPWTRSPSSEPAWQSTPKPPRIPRRAVNPTTSRHAGKATGSP